MKTNYLLLVFLLIGSACLGQELKWREGMLRKEDEVVRQPPERTKAYCYNPLLENYIYAGSNGEEYCMFERKDLDKFSFDEFSFEKYNFTKGKEYKTPYMTLPKYKGFKRIPRNIIQINRQTYVISLANDTKNQVSHYLIERLDIKNLELVELKPLMQLNYGGDASKEGVSTTFITDSDNKKLLCIYHYNQKDKELRNYKFSVYNEQFEIDWEEKVRLPNKSRAIGSDEILLTTNGNLYLKGTVENKDRKVDPTKEEWFYIFNEGKQVKRFAIGEKVEGLKMNCLTWNLLGDDLVCTAFLYRKKLALFQGGYYLKFSAKDLAIEKEVYTPFLDVEDYKYAFNSTTEQPEYWKNSKEGIIALGDFVTGWTISSEDGSFYSVFRYKSGRARLQGVGSPYVSKDIYVFKYNKDGRMEWIRRVPLEGQGDRPYEFFLNGGCLHLLFNDNVENLQVTEVDKISVLPNNASGMDKCCLMDVCIQNDGTYSSKVLQKYTDLSINGGTYKFIFPDLKAFDKVLLLAHDKKEASRVLGLLRY